MANENGPNENGVAGRKSHVRPGGLTAVKRRSFLDALAATCCVTGAAEAAGHDHSAFYALKRRDAGFAGEWAEALAVGYDAMEAKLLGYVMAGGGERCAAAAESDGEGGEAGGSGVEASAAWQPGTGQPLDRALDRAPAWVQVGLLLLNRHRASVAGGKPGIKARRIATPEETDALLNKKLDQLARSLKRKEGGAA